MNKRLLALLTVLALLMACVPGGVTAAGTQEQQTAPELLTEGQETETQASATPEAHSHGGATAHDCEHCDAENIEWIAWGDDEAEKTTAPTGTGHYYLVADIQVTATTDVNNSADLVLCLNGYTIDAKLQKYIYRVGTNGSETDKTKVTVSDCTAYTDAEGVYHAGALSNGKGKDGGGAFFMRGASSLYMYAGKLTGHQNTQTVAGGYGGGAITSRNTATIYLENVEISGCSTTTEGGAIGARDKVQITLKNVVLKDNTATKDGGAVYLAGANNKLEATGCTFEGNTATGNGGAICTAGGGTVTVTGGKFHDNGADGLGGAIYTKASDVTVTGTAEEYVQFTQNSGEVKSNGGAILATGTCDLRLQYVQMTGNTATGNGASALMLTGGAMGYVADSTITGNANAENGTFRGAVYVTGTTSVLTLSGKVVIKDNGSADLYIQNNSYNRTNDDCWLVVDGMTEGSEVVLFTHTSVAEDETRLNNRIIDGQPESWQKGWIVYDANSMAVDYDRDSDKFFFTDNAPETTHIHCDCGDGTDAHCDHTQNAYLPWTDGTNLPVSGTYYLETDVVLSESVRIEGNLQLCLNGHNITVEYAEQGNTKDRIFTMNSTDALTLSDCAAKTENGVYTAGKLTGSSYTAVMVANSSTSDNTVVIDFYDGIFTGNQSSAGAAFSIQDGATLNMYGGEISGNHSTNLGGAIYVGSNGNFHMYGGTITGNTADGKGTVYVDSSAVSLLGGTVTGNTAAAGAGVYVNKSPITMGGAPVITGNTAGGNASNLYLQGTAEITFDTMGQGQIGISADTAPRYLSADMGQTDVSTCFTPDSQYRVLEVKDNRLHLTYTSDHGHCVCGGADANCDHTEAAWMPWESTTGLPTAEGYYYLLHDVTLDTYAEFSAGHVHLCLNGHTVTAAGEENTKFDRHITIQKDAKLTISDCTAKTENGVYTAGKFTGGTSGFLMILNQTAAGATNNVTVNFYDGIVTGNSVTGTGGIITVQDLAVFNLYGGEISNNTGMLNADNEGGMGAAFYAGSNGIINIHDGVITGNSCEHSGTVYVTGNSTLNMYGGEITGNTVGKNGGGVLLNGTQTVMTMTGGTISNNTAGGAAGGVLIQAKATLNLEDGTISGNNCGNDGGGIYASTNSFLNISGGKVTGNQAKGSAGGVNAFGATVTMTGGEISGNTATNGGGLAARLGERTVDDQKVRDVPCTVTVQGGKISGNKATEVGGGVFTHGDGTVFNLEGGEISGNDAPSGGGVIAQINSVMNISGGKITGNTAKNGAGLYASYTSVVNMEGGEVSSNKASNNGGGIYSLGAPLNLSGGKISGNSAKKSGGGIYTSKYTRFTGTPEEITYTTQMELKGVNVTGNSTGGNGGGICANNGAVINMTAGSVSGNTAANAAGGILAQSKSQLNLKGGSVSNNSAKSGGGVYISTDCKINMTGGSVSGNTAAKSAAGMYLLKAEAVLGGGSISNNSSGTNGGGIFMAGSQVKLSGTNITDNKATGNGGGICTTKRTSKGVDYYTNIVMTAGKISGNTAVSGGGVLLQSFTTMTMKGGIIEHNRTEKDGAGIYVSTNCTFHMDGGEIRNNTAERNGGGLYNLKSTVNYNAGKITGNTATGNGGAMVMSGQGYVVNMKEGMVITENTAMNGGAIVVQGRVTLNMENVDLTDNCATTGNGGAIYLSTNSFLNIKGGSITNHSCDGHGGAIFSTTNSTLTMDGMTIQNNKAGYGGALSLGGTVNMTNVTIAQNEATEEGGGIYCNKLKVGGLYENHLITIKDTVIENNKSGKQGGGIYVIRGSKCLFDGLTVQGNTSGLEGGGLYVVDDTSMYNMTVTGNTSGGEGYALYLANSEYDGESYFIGIFKLGGEMKVTGNQGGDMYFGAQTAAAVDHMGLTGDTRMDITLYEGYLTQVLQGVYDYEGGELSYVVTAGDRSITDPEYDALWNDQFKTEEPTEEPTGDDTGDGEQTAVNPVIWIVCGAGAVVIAAVIAIIAVLGKKKKTAAEK